MTYLNFVFTGKSASGKTGMWAVLNFKNRPLGYISWYGAWRKYVFITGNQAVLDDKCLKEIAQFILDITLQHKTKTNAEASEAKPTPEQTILATQDKL